MNPTLFRQFGNPRLHLPRSARHCLKNPIAVAELVKSFGLRCAPKVLTTSATILETKPSILCVLGILMLSFVCSVGVGQTTDSLDKDYSAELPRFEPLSPEQAIESLEVLDGFRVELVASEPLVVDPIAFAFDARSRLFVVEMRDYSEQDKEHLGRIALLSDTDGDGRMDHRSTFVDGLSWPTAIHPWRDGVIVAAPPRMTWFRDTDDDGRADRSEVWFDGFGRSNVQGMTNSLRWGVDCFLHGATSSTGANLRSSNQPAQTLRRTDFAIDTLQKTLHPVSGGGQHGLSFNRWGDKFVTSNSDHLQQVIDMHDWLASHRPKVTMPSLRRSITLDGQQAEVFRASPVEPWRIVRTRLRVGGIVGGPVEGGGRAAGYFTGATGTWIADNEAGFSLDSEDAALVCDVGSNLIHRKSLKDKGLYWEADRVDTAVELLRSTDTWFRPVQLGDGPDGAVYIADMYREVIEHPKSLPEVIKRHLDLTSGRDRGRIWRLVSNSSQLPKPSFVDMTHMTEAQLLNELASPIAWRRRTASQLLVERGVEDKQKLLQAAVNTKRPEAQVLAVHVASRLQFFDSSWAKQLLQDRNTRVQEHALRLIRVNELGNQLSAELTQFTQKMIRDDQVTSARIILELAMLTADMDQQTKSGVLPTLMRRAELPLLRATLANTAQFLAPESVAQRMDPADLGEWLPLLLPSWIDLAREDEPLRSWLANQLLLPDTLAAAVWIEAVSRLSSSQYALVRQTLGLEQRTKLRDRILASVEEQPKKFMWLKLLPTEDQTAWIEHQLNPGNPITSQLNAIELLDSANHPDTASTLLSNFHQLTPSLQRRALQILTSRADCTAALLQAIEDQTIRPNQIGAEAKSLLRSSRDREVASRAKALFGSASSDRSEVLRKYQDVLNSVQDLEPVETLEAGKRHFKKSCSQCHQVAGLGSNVGAALKQLSEKTPEQLLTAILDPNREVDPRFQAYSVLVDGKTLAGVIESENASQIVLVESGGTRHQILREHIELLRNQGQSLMPVGFEDQLSPQQMLQLIYFLQNH